MRYTNEIKVGAAIVIATVIFVLGLRYFQNLPLFAGTYELIAEFEEADGLISGNGVRISGVTVGSVDEVYIDPGTLRVRVRFHVDEEIPVTEGSTAQITGLDALGVVRMELKLGLPDGPRIPKGGMVESLPASDVFGAIAEKAPGIVDQLDRVLVNLNSVLGEADALISEPDSDLRQTLVSVQRTAGTLDDLLAEERSRIGRILGNVESFSEGMDRVVGENGDSMAVLIRDLRGTLARLDASLETLDGVAASATELLGKINDGEGTLGLFVNDPSVYRKMDSVLTNLDALLTDLQRDPARYLKELRLIEIF